MQWILLGLLAAMVLWRFLPKRGVVQIAPKALQEQLAAGERPLILDVREAHEFASGHIPGARNLPLSTLKQAPTDLKTDAPIILLCASGMRSQTAYQRLQGWGFTNLQNMTGGMSRWSGPRSTK